MTGAEGKATAAHQSDNKAHPGAEHKGERKPVRARHDEKWKIFSGTANDALAQ